MRIIGFHCLSPRTDSKSSAAGSTRIISSWSVTSPWLEAGRQAEYWDGCSKASKHWPGEGNKTFLRSVQEIWEPGDMTRAGRPVASLEKWPRAPSGLKGTLSMWAWRWEALQAQWGQLILTRHCQQVVLKVWKKKSLGSHLIQCTLHSTDSGDSESSFNTLSS